MCTCSVQIMAIDATDKALQDGGTSGDHLLLLLKPSVPIDPLPHSQA
jgi:hypothetical protein